MKRISIILSLLTLFALTGCANSRDDVSAFSEVTGTDQNTTTKSTDFYWAKTHELQLANVTLHTVDQIPNVEDDKFHSLSRNIMNLDIHVLEAHEDVQVSVASVVVVSILAAPENQDLHGVFPGLVAFDFPDSAELFGILINENISLETTFDMTNELPMPELAALIDPGYFDTAMDITSLEVWVIYDLSLRWPDGTKKSESLQYMLSIPVSK